MVINGTVPVQSAEDSDVADMKRAVTVNVSINKEGFRVAALARPFPRKSWTEWLARFLCTGRRMTSPS